MEMKRALLVLTAATAVTACGDDSPTTPNNNDMDATVVGRVEQASTQGALQSYGARIFGASDEQPAATAQTVAVASVASDGSLQTLAQADVQADGSFTIEGVPANRTDLQVVAYGSGNAEVGRVMVHEETRAMATVTTAPINMETSVEARAWAKMRARGEAQATSSHEVALFTHVNGNASASLLADSEIEAVADGLAEVGATMTSIYAQSEAALDATARAQLLQEAALRFALDRYNGVALTTAHEAFVQASLDAWVGAGVSAEALATATAGAATALDATVHGHVSSEAAITAQAIAMNLRARERIAADLSTTAYAGAAAEIRSTLSATRAQILSASSSADIRAQLDAAAEASAQAAVSAAVDVLVPTSADLALRSVVETAAAEAMAQANLSVRLEGAANASAVAQATANYRSAVRAAVDAMIEASGSTEADAEAMTSLFIAANGMAHIR